jgi:type I restriction enzyme S subunit
MREVGRIVGGGTPKTDHPEFFAEKGVPWLTPADLYRLKHRYIQRGKRDLTEPGLANSSARLLPKGSVLFSSRAPIGYVAIAANPLATNQGFKSCVPFLSEMAEYIYYFLRATAKEIDRQATGTTFKEVSGKVVGNIPLPLPPLGDQRRIVAKLDKLLGLLEELESRLREVDEHARCFTDSVLHSLMQTSY